MQKVEIKLIGSEINGDIYIHKMTSLSIGQCIINIYRCIDNYYRFLGIITKKIVKFITYTHLRLKMSDFWKFYNRLLRFYNKKK